MDWNAIGAIGEIAGAAAVVISLVYLASQIRVSNRIALRDANMVLMGFNGEVWKHTFASPGLAAVRAKLRQADAGLTPEEYELARDWTALFHHNISAVNICLRTGFLDQQVVDTYLRGFKKIIEEYPGMKPFLRKYCQDLGLRQGASDWWDMILLLCEDKDQAAC